MPSSYCCGCCTLCYAKQIRRGESTVLWFSDQSARQTLRITFECLPASCARNLSIRLQACPPHTTPPASSDTQTLFAETFCPFWKIVPASVPFGHETMWRNHIIQDQGYFSTWQSFFSFSSSSHYVFNGEQEIHVSQRQSFRLYQRNREIVWWGSFKQSGDAVEEKSIDHMQTNPFFRLTCRGQGKTSQRVKVRTTRWDLFQPSSPLPLWGRPALYIRILFLIVLNFVLN